MYLSSTSLSAVFLLLLTVKTFGELDVPFTHIGGGLPRVNDATDSDKSTSQTRDLARSTSSNPKYILLSYYLVDNSCALTPYVNGYLVNGVCLATGGGGSQYFGQDGSNVVQTDYSNPGCTGNAVASGSYPIATCDRSPNIQGVADLKADVTDTVPAFPRGGLSSMTYSSSTCDASSLVGRIDIPTGGCTQAYSSRVGIYYYSVNCTGVSYAYSYWFTDSTCSGIPDRSSSGGSFTSTCADSSVSKCNLPPAAKVNYIINKDAFNKGETLAFSGYNTKAKLTPPDNHLGKSFSTHALPYIKTPDNQYCLDVFGGVRAIHAGATVGTYKCNRQGNQKWVIDAIASDFSAIHPQGHMDLCLDVKRGETKEGAEIVLRDCNGSASQLWAVSSV